MTTDALLDEAPGPSPWYLPTLGPDIPGLYCEAAPGTKEMSGITFLKNDFGIVMLVDFYNYVSALDSYGLLIWHQQHGGLGPSDPVIVRGYSCSSLSPFKAQAEELCALMRARKFPVLTNASPTFECAWPTTVVDQEIKVQIPNELKHRDEVLILCYSSAIRPGPEAGHGNLALMVVSRINGHIKLYPQDWFNDGKVDLGYQWVTRVARGPRTYRVRGDGIRISAFELADDLRHLR